MSHVCKKHERFVPDGQSCPYCEPEAKAVADKLIEEFKKEVKAQATPAQVPGAKTVPGVALPNWMMPWTPPSSNTAAGAGNPLAVWLPRNPNGTAANPQAYTFPIRFTLDPRREAPPGEPPKHEWAINADVCNRCGRTGMELAALGSVPCVMRAKAGHAAWNPQREANRAEEQRLIAAVQRAESDLREFYARKGH